jgi:putative membrane protein
VRSNFNPQAALESVCFAVLGGVLLNLLGSGDYRNYVTPKMEPYLLFAAVVLLVWAAAGLGRLFRPQYRTRAAHCLILAVPVLLLLLPLTSISSTALASGYSATLNGISEIDPSSAAAGGGPQTGSAAGADASSSSSGAAASSSGGSGAQSGGSLMEQYGLSLAKNGTVEVSDDQFYPWLCELYAHMDRYEGKVITIKGFVYRDSSSMASDEFVPARMLMYCCAADLVPCGILCRYDKASELKDGAWVTVTGKIHVETDQDQRQPVVTVTGTAPAREPQEEYVYPW